MKMSGKRSCWSCCVSSSPEEGTTKTVRKTTRNGETVVTTTYTSNSSIATGRVKLEPMSMGCLGSKEKIQTETEPSAKATPIRGPQFEKECLDEHNRLRALHGCPPLKLNKDLCKIAQKWAVNMANSNVMQHSNGKYGENLYMCSGFFIDGKKAVESWYNEIKQYNFRNPSFSNKTGHFTQVVWKDSKELGVGVEIRGNTTWVVANYDPPGNLSNCYEQNVPRP